MVYAHSIDLDWLDGSEYHTFLLWIVRNIAGVDGYNGLISGQVRFSRREVEDLLKVGHTKASNLIQRAVCDGLLSPLSKSQNRKGMGEIYETLAGLRQTRICTGPTTDQQRFLSGPANSLVLNNLPPPTDQQRTNNGSLADRLIEETKETKDIISPQTEKRKRKPKEEKPKEPTKLEEILEWNDLDYSEVFWEVIGPFPANKKTWPMTMAKTFMKAVKSGVDPTDIHTAAIKLSKTTDPQYMPNVAKWLNEQGWRAYATGT